MNNDDLLRLITQNFYRMLSAKTNEGANVITVDFSKLPQFYSFAIPQPVIYEAHADPMTINALDLIEMTMPGLWGYANNAGLKKVEICTCCGKEHNHRKGGGDEHRTR